MATFNYITQGPPTIPVPAASPALCADVVNGSLYVTSNGVWKPAGAGLVGTVNLSGQTAASLGPTTIYTVVAATAGVYSIDFYTKLTTTGTSPVLGPLVIGFNDAVDGTAQSITAAGQTQAGANATSLTATTTAQTFTGGIVINAGAGAITYTFTVSGTIGAAVYELRIRAEYLG